VIGVLSSWKYDNKQDALDENNQGKLSIILLPLVFFFCVVLKPFFCYNSKIRIN